MRNFSKTLATFMLVAVTFGAGSFNAYASHQRMGCSGFRV
jgi:hypothetical protein